MKTIRLAILAMFLAALLPVVSRAQVGVSPILNGRQIFNARDFGAVPNDTGDDTAGIQAALNAVHTAGGGTVEILTPGVYNVTDLYTSAGSSPTAPNTTLNAALVIYSNTTLRCGPGVGLKLGIAKDDSRCYLLRNADPTGGNSGIVLDGGFYNGGGIVAEAAAPTSTSFTITGDYASRLGAGVVFYVSNFVGKEAFTSTGASYSAPSTTVTVAAVDSDSISAVDVSVNYFSVAGDQTATYKQGQTATVTGNADSSTNASYLVNYVVFTGGATRIYVNDVPAGATVSGTISVGAKAGGFQSSWQASNAQAPALVTCSNSANTITVAGDYTAYGSPGSTVFLYNNGAGTASWNRAFTIQSIDFGGVNTVVTTVEDLAGATESASGNLAFLYNQRWFADLVRLENVTDFTIKNTKGGGVDKYVWHLVGCVRGQVSGNTIDNGSDGFHCAGGCRSIVFRDQKGRTLDNYYAAVADEKWYRPGDATLAGNISDLIFDGLTLDQGKTCFEPFRATGTSAYTVEGITLRSFKGVVGAGYGFRLVDDTASGYGLLTGCTMKKFLAEDIDLGVPDGYAVCQLAGSAVKDATLRNIKISRALNGVVLVATPSGASSTTSVESLTVDGVTTTDVPASTVAPVNAVGAVITKLVQIDANLAKLALSNFQVKLDGYNTSPFSMSGILLQVSDTSDTEGWVQRGTLTNSQVESVCGASMTTSLVSLLNNQNGRSVSSYIDLANVSCVRSGAGAGTFTIVAAAGNHNVDLNGVRVVNTGGGTAPYVTQTTASRTLRIGGAGTSWDTDNDGNFSDDTGAFLSTGAVQFANPSFPLALDSTTAAFLTGVTGDSFFNVSTFSVTSAREALGIGLYRYNGTFWQFDGPSQVVARTADTTLVNKHSGGHFTNTGASGTITFTLPAATVGQRFQFTRTIAQTLRIDPSGTETIALPSTGVQGAAGKYLSMDSTGATVQLECNAAGTWSVAGYSGTMTAEP